MPMRLVKVDLVDRLSPRFPTVAAQAIVALWCSALAVASRALIDTVFPSAGPFALTFPFVLAATLFGRWGAGVCVMVFCALYAWYSVLPFHGSFALEDPKDGPRVLINVFSGFLLVGIGEYFRRRTRRALEERDAIAEDRRILLDELNHRVKNNFAIISALIRMDARHAGVETAEALNRVSSRMESIAAAHYALEGGATNYEQIGMQKYLKIVCSALDTAFFDGDGTIRVSVDDVTLPRDRAVAIGLLVNELCTNAAKHAFPDTAEPEIKVSLARAAKQVTLTVADNGVGMTRTEADWEGTGQGRTLVSAFANQAGGELEKLDVDAGTSFRLVLNDVV